MPGQRAQLLQRQWSSAIFKRRPPCPLEEDHKQQHRPTQKSQIIKTGKDVFQPGKLIYVISYTLLAPARNSPRDFSKLPDSTVAQNRVRQELFGRGRFAEHVPRDFRCVILDESHYIKGADSNRTQSVLDVCRRATRCLLLSGTPTPNHPLELVPQLQALYPDLRDHQIVNGRTFLGIVCVRRVLSEFSSWRYLWAHCCV